MTLFAHDVRGRMASKKDSLSKNQTSILSIIYGFIQIAAEEKRYSFVIKTKKLLSYDDTALEMLWLWKSEKEFFSGIMDTLKDNGFKVTFIKYNTSDNEEDNSIVVDWKEDTVSV